MGVRNDWETPPELYNLLDREFGFTLDVSASPENAKCTAFFDKSMDGLAQPWVNNTCWMNPPYSIDGKAVIRCWLEKAHEEAEVGATTVALVPNAQSERWWDYCELAAEIRTLVPRVPFLVPGETKWAPPFGVALVVFRPKQPEAPPLRWRWNWRNAVSRQEGKG